MLPVSSDGDVTKPQPIRKGCHQVSKALSKIDTFPLLKKGKVNSSYHRWFLLWTKSDVDRTMSLAGMFLENQTLKLCSLTRRCRHCHTVLIPSSRNLNDTDWTLTELLQITIWAMWHECCINSETVWVLQPSPAVKIHRWPPSPWGLWGLCVFFPP